MKITKKELVILLGVELASALKNQNEQYAGIDIAVLKEAYKQAFLNACPKKDRQMMQELLNDNAVIAKQIVHCVKKWDLINKIMPKKCEKIRENILLNLKDKKNAA